MEKEKSKQYAINLTERIKNNFKIENYLDKMINKYITRKNICFFSSHHILVEVEKNF